MEKSLLFFLQGIPESIGEIAFSLALAKVPLRWGIITITGTVMTIIIFIIRSLPFTFGLHTVAWILFLVFFFKKATNVLLAKSFIVVFASVVTLGLIELSLHEIFFTFTKLDPKIVMLDDLLWKLIGLPQAILMILIAVMISRYIIPNKGAWKI